MLVLGFIDFIQMILTLFNEKLAISLSFHILQWKIKSKAIYRIWMRFNCSHLRVKKTSNFSRMVGHLAL